jgi:hypothetical protein
MSDSTRLFWDGTDVCTVLESAVINEVELQAQIDGLQAILDQAKALKIANTTTAPEVAPAAAEQATAPAAAPVAEAVPAAPEVPVAPVAPVEGSAPIEVPPVQV